MAKAATTGVFRASSLSISSSPDAVRPRRLTLSFFRSTKRSKEDAAQQLQSKQATLQWWPTLSQGSPVSSPATLHRRPTFTHFKTPGVEQPQPPSPRMTSAVPGGPECIVMGGMNMDLKAAADGSWPDSNATASGKFTMAPGGRAGNQAVAVSRLGVPTHVIARVGEDENGRILVNSLSDGGINVDGVSFDRHEATGVAVQILTMHDRKKFTVACKGANNSLAARHVEAVFDAKLAALEERGVLHGSIVLVQLEIELEPMLTVLHRAHDRGLLVVLKASPLPYALSRATHLLAAGLVDVVIANEHEAGFLLHWEREHIPLLTASDAQRAAAAIVARWPTLQCALVSAQAGCVLHTRPGGLLGQHLRPRERIAADKAALAGDLHQQLPAPPSTPEPPEPHELQLSELQPSPLPAINRARFANAARRASAAVPVRTKRVSLGDSRPPEHERYTANMPTPVQPPPPESSAEVVGPPLSSPPSSRESSFTKLRTADTSEHGAWPAAPTLSEPLIFVLPIRSVKITDVTGANDAFAAGFVAALCRGFDSRQALLWAHAASMLCLMRMGAQSGMPAYEELTRFLAHELGMEGRNLPSGLPIRHLFERQMNFAHEGAAKSIVALRPESYMLQTSMHRAVVLADLASVVELLRTDPAAEQRSAKRASFAREDEVAGMPGAEGGEVRSSPEENSEKEVTGSLLAGASAAESASSDNRPRWGKLRNHETFKQPEVSSDRDTSRGFGNIVLSALQSNRASLVRTAKAVGLELQRTDCFGLTPLQRALVCYELTSRKSHRCLLVLRCLLVYRCTLSSLGAMPPPKTRGFSPSPTDGGPKVPPPPSEHEIVHRANEYFGMNLLEFEEDAMAEASALMLIALIRPADGASSTLDSAVVLLTKHVCALAFEHEPKDAGLASALLYAGSPEDGCTLLIAAAASGCTQLVRKLMVRSREVGGGAGRKEIELHAMSDGATAMHLAASHDQYEACQVTLWARACPHLDAIAISPKHPILPVAGNPLKLGDWREVALLRGQGRAHTARPVQLREAQRI